jgi:hypothetical protein
VVRFDYLEMVSLLEWCRLLGVNSQAILMRALIVGFIDPHLGAVTEELRVLYGGSDDEARRVYGTARGIVSQALELKRTNKGADECFLYTGPVDGLMRPFCAERIGRVYTRRSIEGIDNGGLPNVLLTRGGWVGVSPSLDGDQPLLLGVTRVGGYDEARPRGRGRAEGRP